MCNRSGRNPIARWVFPLLLRPGIRPAISVEFSQMKKLPLHDWHQAHAANMAEFAGYAMAMYYSKPIAEHHKVRREAGVFDISHMGQFLVDGRRAEAFLQYALTNDISGMEEGQARYSAMCRRDGGVLDDVILYRYGPTRYRVIVNGATREKDLAWLRELAQPFSVTVEDLSADYCLFAVQGPQAFAMLAPHFAQPPGTLRYYHFAQTKAMGRPVFVARTGYTGEPGCEIAVALDDAPAIWDALTGQMGFAPIGLAARDTLRLEACMSLYGHELREEWNPLESGLAWAVKLEKTEKLAANDNFVGKEALKAVKARGMSHASVALELRERGIPRAGYPVLGPAEGDPRWERGKETAGGEPAGICTSGTLSPTTGKAIALARVRREMAKVGTALAVEIRGKPVAAEVVAKPFYKNPALRA